MGFVSQITPQEAQGRGHALYDLYLSNWGNATDFIGGVDNESLLFPNRTGGLTARFEFPSVEAIAIGPWSKVDLVGVAFTTNPQNPFQPPGQGSGTVGVGRPFIQRIDGPITFNVSSPLRMATDPLVPQPVQLDGLRQYDNTINPVGGGAAINFGRAMNAVSPIFIDTLLHLQLFFSTPGPILAKRPPFVASRVLAPGGGGLAEAIQLVVPVMGRAGATVHYRSLAGTFDARTTGSLAAGVVGGQSEFQMLPTIGGLTTVAANGDLIHKIDPLGVDFVLCRVASAGAATIVIEVTTWD